MIQQGEPDLEVIGDVADGVEAVALGRKLRPDVVLVDVRMPRLVDIAVTRALSCEPDGPAVVVVTTFDLDEYVFQALRAGSVGFQVVRGLSNGEIAKELSVSEATVKTHVRSMLLKLQLRDRTQLVIAAYESGVPWALRR